MRKVATLYGACPLTYASDTFRGLRTLRISLHPPRQRVKRFVYGGPKNNYPGQARVDALLFCGVLLLLLPLKPAGGPGDNGELSLPFDPWPGASIS